VPVREDKTSLPEAGIIGHGPHGVVALSCRIIILAATPTVRVPVFSLDR